jgi:hypothetical protein
MSEQFLGLWNGQGIDPILQSVTTQAVLSRMIYAKS